MALGLFKTKEMREEEEREEREYYRFMKQYDLIHKTNYSQKHFIKTRSVREKEKEGHEIYKRITDDYDRALNAVFPNGNSEFEINRVKREMRESRLDQDKRFERTYNIQYVLLTPLILIFSVLGWGLKISLGVSALSFFYGLYMAFKKFVLHASVNATHIVLLIILPFIISVVLFVVNELVDAMKTQLGYSES